MKSSLRGRMSTRSVGFWNPDRVVLAFLVVLHVGAACQFFPPSEVFVSEPLHAVDHPVHAHRIHLYRASLFESGLPWGYDPMVSAGSVTDPIQDVGARPQQVLGVLLPFLSPGAVGRLFLFLAALTFPLWTMLACRRFGLSEGRQVWILLMLLLAGWMIPKALNIWHEGLISFVYSSYFAIFVLAVFLDFVKTPTARLYVLLCLSATGLFLVHILGPVVLLPSLVVCALFARALSLRLKAGLMFVPLIVLALNSFWFIPFLFAHGMPQPEGLLATYPADAAVHKLFTGWGHLLETLLDPLTAAPLVAGSVLAALGVTILWKEGRHPLAVAVGVACLTGLILWLFGSFVPVTARMQPVRFKTTAFAFMAIPAGIALAAAADRVRIHGSLAAVVIAGLFASYAAATERPRQLALPPDRDPLAEFMVSRTSPDDRLLIQSPDGYQIRHYETKIFPLVYGREVLGSNFPAVWDPPQFLRTRLLGRRIEEWRPEQLRGALARWGAAWVFTYTTKADSLLVATTGQPGERVGDHLAFHVDGSSSRFLVGSGNVAVRVNRIELSELNPENGLVVLRYRYHPAWRAEPEFPVYQYPVEEDVSGFIALRDPPSSLTLHFHPWRMLRASWPDARMLARDFHPDVAH